MQMNMKMNKGVMCEFCHAHFNGQLPTIILCARLKLPYLQAMIQLSTLLIYHENYKTTFIVTFMANRQLSAFFHKDSHQLINVSGRYFLKVTCPALEKIPWIVLTLFKMKKMRSWWSNFSSVFRIIFVLGLMLIK